MNKKPRKYEWYADPQGGVTAGWGLCMSARDMAVIGAMVLGSGLYNGKRIISEEYINLPKGVHPPLLQPGARVVYRAIKNYVLTTTHDQDMPHFAGLCHL